MTKLLEKAFDAVSSLSPEAQNDIAHVLLRLIGTDEEPLIMLCSEERSALDASREAARRGEFATEEEVRAVWRKHGL